MFQGLTALKALTAKSNSMVFLNMLALVFISARYFKILLFNVKMFVLQG